MARHLRAIVLFVLLGVVVNVGVAWGFGTDRPGVLTSRVAPLGMIEPSEDWVVCGLEDFSLPWVVVGGWPVESLERTVAFDVLYDAPEDAAVLASSVGGWHVPRLLFKDPVLGSARLLSLRPIWPGFAVNTVFYAVVLWLLIRGPFVLRRLIRTRRGLCPACAYPVGTSPVCTECGGQVRRRMTGAT